MHPSQPRRLLEVTIPGSTQPAPPPEDAAQWATLVDAVRANANAVTADQTMAVSVVTLTDLMRTCPITDGTGSTRRGAIRFETELRPTDDQWAAYRNGTLAWEDLPWVQGNYGARSGLRQAWVRIELQLVPSEGDAMAADSAIPFLGSAAVYYRLQQ